MSLLAMDRAMAVNSDHPVPSEMDVSDEVPSNVDWYKTFCHTSGVELDPVMTKAAMQEEVQYMRSLFVWRDIRADEVLEGEKKLSTKWVLVQKGPVVRGRFVACEVKYFSVGGSRALCGNIAAGGGSSVGILRGNQRELSP